MLELRTTLAPSIADLAALGADSPEAVLGVGGRLWGEPHAQVVHRREGDELLRVPLPGTSTDGLGLLGRPAGAGTGWIYVRRIRAVPLRERLRLRLRHPRSLSAAEHEWNLLCLLRAAGVTTPEPLAVVAEDHPVFAVRSALVTRELDGFRPAREWLRLVEDPVRRQLGLAAIGKLFARLRRASVELPEVAPEALWLSTPDPDSDCHGPPVGAGELRWRRAPEAALASVRRARWTRSPGPPRGVLDLGRAVADELNAGELLRVGHHAVRDLPRRHRRAFLKNV